MNLSDYIAHVTAIHSTEDRYPDFSATHLFYLGEKKEVDKCMEDLFDDLMHDNKERTPVPFDDFSIILNCETSGDWIFRRTIKQSKPSPLDLSAGGEWFLTYNILTRKAGEEMLSAPIPVEYGGTEVTDESGKPRMKLLITNEIIEAAFSGMRQQDLLITREQSLERIKNALMFTFLEPALISHPANYIVKVTPGLTTKEQRKVSSGKPCPAEKTPHFIIVDHDVLVRMSGRHEADGTHASPIPHHRRGHWMRLAERCRHAKLLGKEKVFVKPTYVGERVFNDAKNHYEVIMNFNKGQATE